MTIIKTLKISVLYFFLNIGIINGQSLIMYNGQSSLIIKKGKRLTIVYQNDDIKNSKTGEFLNVVDENVILRETVTETEIKIDINTITNLKTTVAPTGSLVKRLNYFITIGGILAGTYSAVWIIEEGDWGDGIGMAIGLIVTPAVAIYGGMLGAIGGMFLGSISHLIKYSYPREYKMKNDNWKFLYERSIK